MSCNNQRELDHVLPAHCAHVNSPSNRLFSPPHADSTVLGRVNLLDADKQLVVSGFLVRKNGPNNFHFAVNKNKIDKDNTSSFKKLTDDYEAVEQVELVDLVPASGDDDDKLYTVDEFNTLISDDFTNLGYAGVWGWMRERAWERDLWH